MSYVAARQFMPGARARPPVTSKAAPTPEFRADLTRWAKSVGTSKASVPPLDIDRECWFFARWFAHTILKNGPLTDKLGGPTPIHRAAGTSPNSIGGAIVPPGATTLIIALRNLASVARQNCQVVTMGTDNLPVPRRTSGLSVGFIGEGQVLPETQNVFDAVELTARKAATFMRMSNDFSEDTAADFAAYVMQEVANGFGLFEDNVWLNGDGTSTYYGMRGVNNLLVDGNHNAGKVTATAGHNTFATIDVSDLSSLMGALPDYAWPGCKFYCSNFAAAETFARLGAVGGGTVMTSAGRRQQLTYCGIPIVQTSKMPTSSSSLAGSVMILFGDASMATMLGYDREMTLASSQNRYLDSDQTAVRATERFCVVSHSLGDNSNAGALVGLAGGA